MTTLIQINRNQTVSKQTLFETVRVGRTLIRFFVVGSKFWKFDPTQKPPVSKAYPKPISNWDGIPDNLDAALHYTNGYTYFFKDENYYRFNDRTFAVSALTDNNDATTVRVCLFCWRWTRLRVEAPGGREVIIGGFPFDIYCTSRSGRLNCFS